MNAHELTRFVSGVHLGLVFLAATAAFVVLYFGFAFGSLLLRARLLPALDLGAVLDGRPVPAGQVRLEVLLSLVSIAIFGLYGVITVVAIRRGFVTLTTELSLPTLPLDAALIFLWNIACRVFTSAAPFCPPFLPGSDATRATGGSSPGPFWFACPL